MRCARPTGNSYIVAPSTILRNTSRHEAKAAAKAARMTIIEESKNARPRTVSRPEPESPDPKEDGRGILLV